VSILFAVLVAGSTVSAPPEVAPKPRLVDPQIKAFVAYLTKNGITLTQTPDEWWVVTDPKEKGVEVIVHLRSFPLTATEKEMRDVLMTINLAYILNPEAHLAMSYPGFRATDIAMIPKPAQVPTVAMLKTLFNTYAPPEPKK
jgi:hypothetical protein